jgi:sugar lactone lactonase YvrE
MRKLDLCTGVSATVALLCLPLAAVETKTWNQESMADFEKGTLTRVSLSSEGHLTLAPAVRELADASVAFLWAVARDSKGNVYAGGGGLGGGKAKLLALDSQGRSRALAELDGIAVQAIAIDRQDRIYAATSPDGQVYRVDASGKVEPFYDPKTKYIWALAFAPNGDLFVATGDQGEIHRVTPTGVGSVFFRTEETHARSLAVDASGNVIAGTDPDGLVIRITPSGDGFVLHQTAKREVTAVAVAADGSIYAAAVGNRQQPAAAATQAPQPLAGQPAAAVANPVARPALPAPLTITTNAPAVTGGSEVYHILADGYPRKVWSHAQDLVYALSFDAQGRAVVGTGNRGAVYRVDNDHSYTRLLAVEPTQVTAMTAGPGGAIYAVTGNIGKVFSIGPGLETSGTYESDVLDAAAFTYWGRIMSEPAASSGAVFETRSGNLNRAQRNWSPWARLTNGRITSPSARFLQYRATLSGSAEIKEIYLAYQMKNVAPVIDEVEMTAANYRFPAPATPVVPAAPTLTLPPLGRRPAAAAAALDTGGSPTLTFTKGQLGVRWLATDENNDTLLFKVEIRGANESTWKLIRDKVRERYLSWDSTAFPDGRYVLRITASDAPSNPPDQALSNARETDSFQVDNSPPEITGLTGSATGGKIEVRFHAKDALSWLSKAEYSVNGGEWLVVEPTTRLTDSSEHDYRVQVDAQGETTIAVRVADEYENQAVAKVVVR